MHPKTVDLLTFIVLTLTLLALCVYTAYTRLLHSATLEQTRLSRMPSLIHGENHDYQHGEKAFLVRNIGHGVAVNIRIELGEPESIPNIEFKFDDIDSIEPGQEKEVRVQTFIDGVLFEDGWKLLHLKKGDPEV
ncbi:MAG TPA: hypothetical protein VN317_03960, partial [Candidatus Methanoperedens sp.]|nr:hypothetical protein [Candidatus Methanoperedens sp.]